MPEAKHTPGPWGRSGTEASSRPGVICETYSWMGVDEADANECLMAATPEVYETSQAKGARSRVQNERHSGTQKFRLQPGWSLETILSGRTSGGVNLTNLGVAQQAAVLEAAMTRSGNDQHRIFVKIG